MGRKWNPAGEPDLQLVLEDRDLLPVGGSELTPGGRESQGYADSQLQAGDGHAHDADAAGGQAAQGRPEALPVVLRRWGAGNGGVVRSVVGPPP